MVAVDLRGEIGAVVSCFRKCDRFDRTSLLNWSYIRLTAIFRISPEIFLPRFGAKGVKKGANDVLMPAGNPSAVLRESTRHLSRRAEPGSSHRNGSVGTGRKATAAAFQPSLFPADDLPGFVVAVVVAWGLVVSGDLSLAAWRGPIVDGLLARYSNKRTLAKVLDEMSRLFRFLAAIGAECWSDVTRETLEQWYWAARPDRHGVMRRPSESTVMNRHWVAGAVLKMAESLGAPVDAAALLATPLSRRAIKPPTRSLTEVEVRQAQDHSYEAMMKSTRPLMVAFSITGGTATEIAVMPVSAVNLEAATVEFQGEAARTNRLEGWALETVSRYFKHNPGLDHDALLCVSGRTDEFQAAHSVTVRLREVLVEAGIAGRDGVTARSFRLTGARRVLDASGIEAAARFLGSNSLDAVADALGHDWRNGDGG